MAQDNGTSLSPQKDVPTDIFIKIYTELGVDIDTDDEIAAYEQALTRLRAKGSKEGIHLLEIGAGTGRISNDLATIDGVKQYVGIDPHEENLSHAKRKHPQLDLRVQNFFLLPMSEYYDVICVPYTLINMFDWRRQEVFLRKALAQGETVVFDTILPDNHGKQEDTALRVGSAEFAGYDYEIMAHYFCRKHLEEIAFEAGVSDVTFINYPFIKKGGVHFEHTLVVCSK